MGLDEREVPLRAKIRKRKFYGVYCWTAFCPGGQEDCGILGAYSGWNWAFDATERHLQWCHPPNLQLLEYGREQREKQLRDSHAWLDSRRLWEDQENGSILLRRLSRERGE